MKKITLLLFAFCVVFLAGCESTAEGGRVKDMDSFIKKYGLDE